MPRRAPSCRPLETTRAGAAAPSTGLAVVDRDAARSALADPLRRRVLAALQTPGSSTTVARTLGLPRQRVNYHVRALEAAGLIEEVSRVQRRGAIERVVRATAAHYVVSSEALGVLGGPDAGTPDKFSATYQVAVAARTIREIARLASRARTSGKRLTTLTLDTEVRFASPAARAAFADELVATFNQLAAKYHDASAPNGRAYRGYVGAHPAAAE